MNIDAFSPIGNAVTVAASVANARAQITTALSIEIPMNLRIYNPATVQAEIAMGGASVDASTDVQALSVPAGGERVVTWKPGSTYVAVVLPSGTANVEFQLGAGV